MIAIVNYGVGNLFSIARSIEKVGGEATVTGDKALISIADKIILPGVGAFEDAIAKLRESGIDEIIKQRAEGGVPLLGICLGMQLLFDKSYEYGEHDGLGLISGKVVPIAQKSSEVKIPHIGWNSLDITKPSPIFSGIRNGDYVYFVHSYCASDCCNSVIATTSYGADITAAVQSGNIYGCQFHPEKSGEVGLKILKAFTEL